MIEEINSYCRELREVLEKLAFEQVLEEWIGLWLVEL